MAAMRILNRFIAKQTLLPLYQPSSGALIGPSKWALARPISSTPTRPASSAWAPPDGLPAKPSARLVEVQQLISASQERAKDANQPIPKISLEHVMVSFARSSGPGGQNVNKVNSKVDMRFNVKDAYWLSEKVKEKILQREKNRINKEGELVITSTKTRTQKGNIEDALEKLQAIIDAASYVPSAPSEEKIKKMQDLAVIGEQKRLDRKKENSLRKASRGSRHSWGDY